VLIKVSIYIYIYMCVLLRWFRLLMILSFLLFRSNCSFKAKRDYCLNWNEKKEKQEDPLIDNRTSFISFYTIHFNRNINIIIDFRMISNKKKQKTVWFLFFFLIYIYNQLIYHVFSLGILCCLVLHFSYNLESLS